MEQTREGSYLLDGEEEGPGKKAGGLIGMRLVGQPGRCCELGNRLGGIACSHYFEKLDGIVNPQWVITELDQLSTLEKRDY